MSTTNLAKSDTRPGFAPLGTQEPVGETIQLELFDPDDDGVDLPQWLESLPLGPLGDE
jgi:hypothetical protein